jgi:serine/threonine protein phosphatase PrpC
MATVMSLQVRTTASSSTTTTTTMEAAARNKSKDDQECPAYGCPLLPQDIYYQNESKAALQEIRLLKRNDLVERNQKKNNKSDNDTTKAALETLSSSGSSHQATLTLIGYKGGPLEVQVNQDRSIVVNPYHLDGSSSSSKGTKSSSSSSASSKLVGVFDGHANLGERVSQYVVETLPKLLAEKFQADPNPEHIPQILIDTFVELDKTAPAEISGGCTATIILQHGTKIYIANAGDSRSFVCLYRSLSNTTQVVAISREDKPELPDERARVEKAGGQVYLPLRGTSRVLYTDPDTGMQSGLAMSRSIGDWEVGKLGVIPDPIVQVLDVNALVETQLSDECEADADDGVRAQCIVDATDDVHIFAVAATDGLMDFATPETIAQTVAASMYQPEGPHLLTGLEQLIYLAAQGWEQSKQGRYRDDIAIAVSELRAPKAVEELRKA